MHAAQSVSHFIMNDMMMMMMMLRCDWVCNAAQAFNNHINSSGYYSYEMKLRVKARRLVCRYNGFSIVVLSWFTFIVVEWTLTQDSCMPTTFCGFILICLKLQVFSFQLAFSLRQVTITVLWLAGKVVIIIMWTCEAHRCTSISSKQIMFWLWWTLHHANMLLLCRSERKS